MTSRHYSNDAKEAGILDRCGLPLNGIKLGVFNIAIYEIIVRCSLKSFEQCISSIIRQNIIWSFVT